MRKAGQEEVRDGEEEDVNIGIIDRRTFRGKNDACRVGRIGQGGRAELCNWAKALKSLQALEFSPNLSPVRVVGRTRLSACRTYNIAPRGLLGGVPERQDASRRILRGLLPSEPGRRGRGIRREGSACIREEGSGSDDWRMVLSERRGRVGCPSVGFPFHGARRGSGVSTLSRRYLSRASRSHPDRGVQIFDALRARARRP
jgi:hypothetical protein